jgi:hypothetical protein
MIAPLPLLPLLESIGCRVIDAVALLMHLAFFFFLCRLLMARCGLVFLVLVSFEHQSILGLVPHATSRSQSA